MDSKDISNEQPNTKLFEDFFNRPQLLSYDRSPLQDPSVNFNSEWHLPAQLSVFTGREMALTQLAESFNQNTQSCVIRNTKKITGTGGIGKTQLAIEFAHRALQKKRFDNVIWLNADQSTNNQLHNEITILAQAMKITSADSDSIKLMQLIYQHLSGLGASLIILDNATDYQSLTPYLPKNQSEIKVLITTRDANSWSEQFEQIILDIFTPEEAQEYLQKTLKHHFEQKSAVELSEALGRFPLGLAQAVGYIITRNVSISQYLELYSHQKENQKKLLDTEGFKAEPHKQTIWITVNLCLEQLKLANTKEILTKCALLSAQLPISKELLSYDGIKRKFDINPIITELQNYSLIDPSTMESYIQIHQLVQDIVLLVMEKNGTDLDSMIHDMILICIRHGSTLEHREKAFSHIQYQLPHSEKIFSSAKEVIKRIQDNPQISDTMIWELMMLKSMTSSTYFRQGDFKSAHQSTLESLAYRESFHQTPKSIATLLVDCYTRLTYSLSAMGDTQGCTRTVMNGLATIREITKSQRSPEEKYLWTSLAYIHFDQGNYKQSYDIMSSVVNDPSNSTETDYFNRVLPLKYMFAILCTKLGYYAQADELFDETYPIMQQHYGNDDIYFATKKIDLSAHYLATKRLELAKKLIDEAYTVMLDQWGEEHTDFASILLNLAIYYEKTNDAVNLIKTLDRAYKIKNKVMGETHPDTIMYRVKLATAEYNTQKNACATIKILEECLHTLSRTYSDTNYYVGEILRVLGQIHVEENNYSQAAHYFLRSYTNITHNFPDNLKRNKSILEYLINCFFQQRKLIDAQTYSEKLINLYKQDETTNRVDLVNQLFLHYLLVLLGSIDLVAARRTLLEAQHLLTRSEPTDQTVLSKLQDNFHQLNGYSLMPFSQFFETANQSEQKEHPLLFDADIFQEIHQEGSVTNLFTITLLLDRLLVLEHYQAVDKIAVALLQKSLYVETILPYYAKSSLALKFLNTAEQNIESCLQLQHNEEMTILRRQVREQKIEYEQLVKVFTLGTAKLKQTTLSPTEAIKLASCAFNLGQYDQTLLILNQAKSTLKDDSLLAPLEFHRARALFMSGHFATAKLAIESSLAVNENEKARALYIKIIQCLEIDGRVKAIFGSFDWQELAKESQSLASKDLIFQNKFNPYN